MRSERRAQDAERGSRRSVRDARLNGFAIHAVAWVIARASWALRRERAPVATALTRRTLAPTLAPTTEAR